MKITGFETTVIELPNRSSYSWRSLQVPIGRYVILKVTTDEGITGLGEAPCILSWGVEHGRYFGEDPHIVCYLIDECFTPHSLHFLSSSFNSFNPYFLYFLETYQSISSKTLSVETMP